MRGLEMFLQTILALGRLSYIVLVLVADLVIMTVMVIAIAIEQ